MTLRFSRSKLIVHYGLTGVVILVDLKYQVIIINGLSVCGLNKALYQAEYFFAAGNNPRFILGPYLTNHQFALLLFNSGSYPINVKTNAVFRDTTAWNHFVIVADTNQTSLTNGLKLYQNGQLLSFTGDSTYPSSGQTLPVNNASYSMYIGQDTQNANYFNGYMAEINFLDAYAPTTSNGGLDSSGNLQVLGETKNSVWIPKNPSGLTYGNNGFRLTFASSDFNTSGSAVTDPHGSSTNVPDGSVADASGSGNHWNVN